MDPRLTELRWQRCLLYDRDLRTDEPGARVRSGTAEIDH